MALSELKLGVLVGGTVLASILLFPVVVFAGAYFIGSIAYRFYRGYTQEMERLRVQTQENSRKQARHREEQKDNIIRPCFPRQGWKGEFRG
jgi:phosphate/sulfate permease